MATARVINPAAGLLARQGLRGGVIEPPSCLTLKLSTSRCVAYSTSSLPRRPQQQKQYQQRQPAFGHRSTTKTLKPGLPGLVSYRFSSTSVPNAVGAVVVGGGPGGLTIAGNLLDSDALKKKPLLWADPTFSGGRVNARYREVPSNTKVGLFVQFAEATGAFREAAASAAAAAAAAADGAEKKKKDALTRLRELPQDEGCRLSHAADLCLQLTEGLARNPDVRQYKGRVVEGVLDEETKQWTVTLDSGNTVTTPSLILCTGSSPISQPLPIVQKVAHKSDSSSSSSQKLQSIDLDTALAPSVLATVLPASSPATVAVVGASHSAILVLMNLYQLASSGSHPHLRVRWFTRNKLRYAEYMPEGWILRDNTGLKGQAAAWARENLDGDSFEKSPVSGVVSKIWTPREPAGEAEKVYERELPACTHVVQAVGYARDEVPRLSVSAVGGDGEKKKGLEVEYDHDSGRFFDKNSSADDKKKTHVPGLFGAGIAFPERVTDPHGNVEYAVGFWKFMKFAKRVVPEWIGGR